MRRTIAFIGLLGALLSPWVMADEHAIACLGRLEPKDGVFNVAGPSTGSGVIRSISVTEGDWVDAGDRLALLDTYELRKAEVNRLEAVLRNARRELNRQQDLAKTSSTSRMSLDDATMNVEVAVADLAAAKARLNLAVVTAPVRGQVLDIHTRPGERIGNEGILELGKTDEMYVIAEVYETDIAKVVPGQTATITLAALPEPITGRVEKSELRVGRLDVLGTDPVAKTDARVVEVKIVLDDPGRVARFTDMQVEVQINI